MDGWMDYAFLDHVISVIKYMSTPHFQYIHITESRYVEKIHFPTLKNEKR